MPTIADLGKSVKAKYPGQYDDLSDSDVGKKVQAKFPGKYDDYTSFPSKGEVSQRARKNLANLYVEKGKEQESREVSQAAGKMGALGAEVAPMVAAAPFTGGMSAGGAIALMGTAGLAGGIAREQVKARTGVGKSPSGSDLAMSLGVDTAVGAASEGLAQGLKWTGKTLMPKLTEQAAQKAEMSATKMVQERAAATEALMTTIKDAAPKFPGRTFWPNNPDLNGQIAVDISKAADRFYSRLEKLPTAKGGLTPEATAAIAKVEDQLALSGGKIASKQRLDGLIQARQELAKAATKPGSTEDVIFKDLVDDLDGTIKGMVRKIGPDAEKLYARSSQLIKTEKDRAVAMTLTQAALGAGIGGILGGKRGAVEGALGGAAAGALAGRPLLKVSSWALQQVLAHPEASKALGSAISYAGVGNEKMAGAMMERALVTAGARDVAKEFLKEQLTGPKSGTAIDQPDPTLMRRP